MRRCLAYDTLGENKMELPFGELFRSADVGKSRSSVLNPLQWMLAILLAGIVSLLLARAPVWLVILLSIMLSATFSLFCVAFIYFMRTEPGALRSEDYSLARHAMDKGFLTPEVARRIQSRERELSAGKSLEVDDARELETKMPRRRKRPEPASSEREDL